MKGGNRALGYTILEVMIVLAVSGVMFLIALNFISGKQEKTSFQQGSNELSSRIQAVISDVTDGQYSDIPLYCDASGGQVSFLGPARGQGQNYDCIYLGKLIHFSIGTTNHKYDVYSLAGARQTTPGTSGKPVTTIADSKLSPVIGNSADLTQTLTTPQNLDITDVKIIDSNGTHDSANDGHSYGFGFIQGLGSTSSSDPTGTTYASGAQSIFMIDATLSSATPDPDPVANISPSTIRQNVQSVCISVSDGTRTALINIGTNNNQLSVSTRQLGEVGSQTCP